MLNAAHDLYYAINAGLPETFYHADVAEFTLFVSAAAIGVFAFPTAVSALRPTTRNRRASAAVALTALLVLSSIAPFAGMAATTSNATDSSVIAVSSSQIYDGTSNTNAIIANQTDGTYFRLSNADDIVKHDSAHGTITSTAAASPTAIREMGDSIAYDEDTGPIHVLSKGGLSERFQIPQGGITQGMAHYDGTIYEFSGEELSAYSDTDGSSEWSQSYSFTGIDIDWSNYQGPYRLFEANDYLYLVTDASGVKKIDPTDGTVVDTYNAETGLDGVTADPESNTLYVLNETGDEYYAVNANDMSQTNTVSTGYTDNYRTFRYSPNNDQLLIGIQSEADYSLYNITEPSTGAKSLYDSYTLYSGDGTAKGADFGHSRDNTSLYLAGANYGDYEIWDTGIESTISATQLVSGRVTTDDGDPAANATVRVTGVNFDNLNGSTQEKRDRAQELLQEASNVTPPNWTDSVDVTADIFDEYDGEVVAVHSQDDWNPGGVGWSGVVEVSNPELGTPRREVADSETVALSLWDTSQEPWLEDSIDGDIDPGATTDGTIVVEQLDPREGWVDKTTVTTQEQISTGSKSHEFARYTFPTGYYRVYPEGHPERGYMVKAGNPDQQFQMVKQDLRDRAGDLTSQARFVKDQFAQNKMQAFTAETNATGHYSVDVPSQFQRVQVGAYHAQGINLTGDQHPFAIALQEFNSGNYNGSFYIPTVERYDVPNQNANVTVTEAQSLLFTDMGRYQNLTTWLNDFFANNSQMFAGAPVDVTNWESFLELRNRYIGMVSSDENATQYLAETYPEYTNESSVTLQPVNASDTGNVTREEVRQYVTETRALADALRHAPITLDPESLEQSVDDRVAVYSDTITTGRYFESFDTVEVRADFADGSSETIPTDTLSLYPRPASGSTEVQVSQYEVPEGKDLTGVRVVFAEAKQGTLEADIENAQRSISETLAVPSDTTKSETDVVVNFEDGTNQTLDAANWTLDTSGSQSAVIIDDWQVPDGKTVVAPIEVNTGTYSEVGTTLNETNWLDATVEFADDSLVGGPDFSPEDVAVVAKYQGKQEEIPQDYWSVNSQMVGADLIEIQDYPLPPNVANVNVEVIAGSDAGLGRTTFGVSNPGFSGEQPGLEGVPISTLTPGPDEQVTFSLTPGERTTFGNITSAEVRGPAGTQLPVNVSNGDEVTFMTNGAGTHTVSVQYQATDGSRFGATFDVTAAEQSMDAPASMKARSSPNGLYMLAGDSLSNGKARLSDGSTVEVAGQIGTDAEVPGEVHAHLEDVEAATRGDTSLRIVRGPDEQGIRDHVTYVIHTEGIPENAYIYQGETPIPKSGTPDGDVDHNGSYTTITLVSDADASTSYSVVRNPGIGDKVRWQIRLALARIDVPVLFASPTGLGTGGTVALLFVVGFRRRGRGGRPLAALTPDADPLAATA